MDNATPMMPEAEWRQEVLKILISFAIRADEPDLREAAEKLCPHSDVTATGRCLFCWKKVNHE